MQTVTDKISFAEFFNLPEVREEFIAAQRELNTHYLHKLSERKFTPSNALDISIKLSAMNAELQMIDKYNEFVRPKKV